MKNIMVLYIITKMYNTEYNNAIVKRLKRSDKRQIARQEHV